MSCAAPSHRDTVILKDIRTILFSSGQALRLYHYHVTEELLQYHRYNPWAAFVTWTYRIYRHEYAFHSLLTLKL